MNTATERLDPPNPQPHIVLPAAQHSVSSTAQANGSIHAIFKNGIGLIDQPGAMAGFLVITGVMGLALFVGMLSTILVVLARENSVDWFLVFCAALAVLGSCISLAMLRADAVSHRYSPVLFDRASRKVHVFVSIKPAWWQLWRWVPTQRVETFDWPNIRAEVVETTHVGGVGVPSKHYGLTLVAVEAPGSSRAQARFGVGLGYPWAPEPVVQMWEHLRRFMGESGPHVAPGDTVFKDQSLQGLWASLGFIQPLLMPGAKGWLTGSDFSGAWWFTLPFSIFALVMLPFTAACGLIRWAAHKAQREPHWPAEILASVGEQIDTNAPRITWTQRRKMLDKERR